MSDNILDSYLVKLGASVDTPSFDKFKSALSVSEKSVTAFASSTITSLFKIETVAIGALSSVGVGLIGLADKTAMADQQYRLFGMRMLMTKDSARAMSVATDELGASLDEIAFDPELNRRFQQLYEQNMKLGKAMGSNFDKNMIGIRDIRMEYKKFTTELEFLSGGVISQMFEKLGYGTGTVQDRMNSLNNWFTDNLPGIANQVSDLLIPVWKDWVTVVTDLGGMFKTAAGDFSFFTGIMTGDRSIQGTEFSIRNVIKATMDWLDVLTEVALTIQLVGKTALHIGTSVTAAFGAITANRRGDYKEAERLTGIVKSEAAAAAQNIKDVFNPGKNDANTRANPDFSGIMRHEDEKAARVETNPTIASMMQVSPGVDRAIHSSGMNTITDTQLAALIQKSGDKYSVDPNLLSALIHQESNYNPAAISSKKAGGLTQLMPGTAKEMGVTDRSDPTQSVEGGAKYLGMLLEKYGDTSKALAAYNAGPSAVNKYEGVPPYAETQEYVSRIMKEYSQFSDQSRREGGGVVIHSVTIQVPHTLPEDQWSDFVNKSMTDITTKNNRNVMAQTAAGAYF